MYQIMLFDRLNPNTYIGIPYKGLPEELEMAVKVDNEEESILNLGGVIRPGKPALREYKLEFVLPHDVVQGDHEPLFYLNFFRDAVENQRVLRLVINRADMENKAIYNTDIPVVIEQYSVKEKYGCVGDMFVDMQLKEYKDHQGKVVQS
ncbi:MAG: hypothetical protein RR992_04320 [Clostridiales bacterium]